MTFDELFFGDSYARRLPIYLVIDNSESMIGEPLEAVNQGINSLIDDLRKEPMAVETAWLSIVTFSSRARQIIPLTDLAGFVSPSLSVGPGTSLGAAFELLGQCLRSEIRKSTVDQKGDWKPIVFLLTDGQPTDDWQVGLDKFREKTKGIAANIIGIGCGDDVDLSVLTTITPNVLLMKNTSPGYFGAFFKWVSASVSTASVSANQEGGKTGLPAPPGTLEVVGSVSPSRAKKPQTQIILPAHCRDTQQGYLMRYRRLASKGVYRAEKSYPVGRDYFGEAEIGPKGQEIDSSILENAPACPYCNRPGWTLADDGRKIICHEHFSPGSKFAQIMFVLDVTGSMQGEISGVKSGIREFVGQVQSRGLSVEVGLIAFRDLLAGQPPEMFKFDGYPFTNDIPTFTEKMKKLKASGGGGNRTESSYDALDLACKQPFRSGVNRIIILITDQPPCLPDGNINEIDDLVAAFQRGRIDQLFIVIPRRIEKDFTQLCQLVGGEFLDLGEDGRGAQALEKNLLDIGKRIQVRTSVG